MGGISIPDYVDAMNSLGIFWGYSVIAIMTIPAIFVIAKKMEKAKKHRENAEKTTRDDIAKKAIEIKEEAQKREDAERLKLEEIEKSVKEKSIPINVIKAAHIVGTTVVITSKPLGYMAAMLTNLDTVENFAPECCWKLEVLIGEGRAGRSIALDLPFFISKSEYEQSKSYPVFVADGRIIYFCGTLFLLSRHYKDEVERDEVILDAKKIVDDEFIEPITLLTNKHIVTLSRKRDQTLYQDDYGNYVIDRWFRELDYFIDNVLRKDDLIASYLLDPGNLLRAKNITFNAIRDYQISQLENNGYLSIDVGSLDPAQFEHYCAEILRDGGWDVRITQASGDQGIDLIANRDGVKAVIQCKKYSRPVGNGAVQEIIAGKQFEQAAIAAVVSNSTFTPSAKQLANATGVHLLHYTELDHFTEKVGLQ